MCESAAFLCTRGGAIVSVPSVRVVFLVTFESIPFPKRKTFSRAFPALFNPTHVFFNAEVRPTHKRTENLYNFHFSSFWVKRVKF
jgi:hypothetical protein